MVLIKKLEEIVKKWTDVTPGRQPYYEAGIKAPLRDWATNAAGAEDAWETGVSEAITDKRFAGGVKAVGTKKWQDHAVAKAKRFSEGVRIAGPDYSAGFAPFHDVISKVTLPPRGARGAAANYDRVKAIGDALHSKKVEMLKGTSPA